MVPLTTVPGTLHFDHHTSPRWIAMHTESARCRQRRFSFCFSQCVGKRSFAVSGDVPLTQRAGNPTG